MVDTTAIPPLIFLDIDGVLNDHEHSHSEFPVCQIKQPNILAFRKVLEAVPNSEIVIISSWGNTDRNPLIQKGYMEWMLRTHGLETKVRRFIRASNVVKGEEAVFRAQRIVSYLQEKLLISHYAIIDDLPLGLERHVQPKHRIGFTEEHITPTINYLTS